MSHPGYRRLRVALHLALLAVGSSFVSGCDDPAKGMPPAAAPAASSPAASSAAPRPAPASVLTASEEDLATRQAAPERLVAIGDLHGDLERTKLALKLAGAIDDGGAWIGGKLWIVQTGDQLDRGDDDRAILDYLGRLRGEAEAAGGKVIFTLGNHEVMNAELDFRYITPGSLPPFAEFEGEAPAGAVAKVPPELKGRAAAFVPGGPYAKKLAEQPVYAFVGDTLFVHAGILPKHVKAGLAKTDRETREWLRGERPSPPAALQGEDGPLWTRLYGAAPGPAECKMLGEVLAAFRAKRMVIGHTVQRGGARSACDDRVWRIDVGLAKHYGGPVEVLEIVGEKAVVLREPAAPGGTPPATTQGAAKNQ